MIRARGMRSDRKIKVSKSMDKDTSVPVYQRRVQTTELGRTFSHLLLPRLKTHGVYVAIAWPHGDLT